MNKKVWMMTALLLAPLMGGCSQAGRDAPVSQVTPAAVGQKAPGVAALPPPIDDGEDVAARMRRCQGELQVLQKVDGKRHAVLKREFDRLMSGAAMYAGVRGDVQSRTQDAVDALYRYRTDRLCADIGQDVLNGLARAGEADGRP